MAPILTHIPPALNHFVIFNPKIKPPAPETTKESETERNRDLEDDIAQAAQILFYTSHAERDVSRDVMLRQVGLVKGLMSFTDMVAPGDDPGFWSVNSQRARIVVYSPEPDFFIYANIALARQIPDDLKGIKADPTSTAQGIPDGMLLDALRRGYADFRLLHGPLQEILSAQTLTVILDKFWTRFALNFESIILVPHPDTAGLRIWLSGYPSPTPDLHSAADRALEVFREDTDLIDFPLGVIGKDGPISTTPTDQALTRYLVNLVISSLPPPVRDPHPQLMPNETVGEIRKSSWTGWVPTMSGIPGLNVKTPASPRSNRTTEITRGGAKEDRSRWPGLGLGGLGESLGGMGQMFTLPGSRSASTANPVDKSARAATSTGSASDTASIVNSAGIATPASKHIGKRDSISSMVIQTDVILPDLEAAQAEPDLELVWDSRNIWLHMGEGYEEQHLSWIIRDSILLCIVYPVPPSDPPSSSATLSLFSKLSAIISAEHDRVPHRSALANSTVNSDDSSTSMSGPEMDAASAVTLKELKHALNLDQGVSEIFARTSGSRFVVAKRSREEETYMLIGKKDASLVDAEHAMKAFERAKISV